MESHQKISYKSNLKNKINKIIQKRKQKSSGMQINTLKNNYNKKYIVKWNIILNIGSRRIMLTLSSPSKPIELSIK